MKRHNIQTHCYSNQRIKVKQLFIEVDEHYVSTQENHQTNKKMIKCAKIYSQINRSQYENRIILFENHQSFWNKIIDTIETHFDVATIQHIYVLGDGASWIKSGVHMFERGKAKYIIDRFHYFQALHHIFTKQHKDLYQIAKTYIMNNQKKSFKLLVNTFAETNRLRDNTINDKKQYILRNWTAFQRSLKYESSCAMESCISHSIAAVCTSRPKGFKVDTLLKQLNLRELYLNTFADENKFYHLLTKNKKRKHMHILPCGNILIKFIKNQHTA